MILRTQMLQHFYLLVAMSNVWKGTSSQIRSHIELKDYNVSCFLIVFHGIFN